MLRKTTLANLILTSLLFAFAVKSNAGDRQKTNIGDSWKFTKGITANTPAASDYNDASWATVTIPHTWNATDAQDGGNNYQRTVSWYRKHLLRDASFAGKRVYIEIQAASLQAECFVNGTSVGLHKGGYNAFRFDITDRLTQEDNVIAIKVDNRRADDIAPLSGDFSFIGGIYRKIFLIVADPVHVDLKDNGSNGLFLTTSNVSAASAQLEVRAKVVNESNQDKTVDLQAVIRHPDSFEEIPQITRTKFDVNAMKPGGAPLHILTENTVTIPAGGSYEFKKQATIANPHLWDGLTDPFRYLVDFTVSQASNPVDKVSDYVGFRFFRADNNGFYLNGRLYPLRGVNRHQDWKDKGYAISDNEHNIDFGMIYDIGANAARLAHYPQDPHFHELFDKYGIVVWVEIPFVNNFGADTALFMQTTRTQLREMIRQRYNRPSILMWGLQNEVSTSSYDAQMSKMIPALHQYAKSEDSSRFTVQAQAGGDRANWTTDLFGQNRYPGWYQSGTAGSFMDGYRNKHSINGKYHPVGLSEYGAGGNVNQHEVYTGTPNTGISTTSQWHPEEYQNAVHEQSIRDIAARAWIWGTFVWNMFDFASDDRNEGSQPGINDKGLVTHNRETKKDSYFAYKAAWNTIDTFVYIASRRFEIRETNTTPVTVYTNSSSAVELFVGGVSQGTRTRTAANCGILKWDNIALPNKGASGSEAAKNTVVAKTAINNLIYTDTVIWNRIMSSSTELTSSQVLIDNVNKKISLSIPIEAARVGEIIQSAWNANLQLFETDGITPVTSGNVAVGMKLKVTAEDGTTTATYEFISMHIAINKPATADAQENTTNTPSKAVDGNLTSRWAAPNNASESAPHWLEVDLGKDYVINEVDVYWFNNENSRSYKYNVQAKKNQTSNYSVVVNRSSNTTAGFVTDAVNNAIARYIRVYITGANASTSYAYPSIYELQIYGWLVESSVYAVDYGNWSITVPYSENLLLQEDFLSNLQFSGVETHRVDGSAYYITDGDRLIIKDSNGRETAFTIKVSPLQGFYTPDLQRSAITNEEEGVRIRLNNDDSADLQICDLSGKIIVAEKIQKSCIVALNKGVYTISLLYPNGKSSVVKHIVSR
jgi:hypothetical protein